jgi:signal transduction histidine kinase
VTDHWNRRFLSRSTIQDASSFTIILIFSLTIGARIIGSPFHLNPKINEIASTARPVAFIAWTATWLQLTLLGFYRRSPVAAWTACVSLVVVHIVTVGWLARLSTHPFGVLPLVPSDALILLFTYEVAFRKDRRTSMLVLGSTFILGVGAAERSVNITFWLSGSMLILVTALVWVLGLNQKIRLEHLLGLLRRADELELSRDRDRMLAVVEERQRLTREMHDGVAHALSVMIIQAQGAASVLRDRPEEAAGAMGSVISVGREAMAEMRRLLITDGESGEPRRTPMPGINDIPRIVHQLRSAGQSVELTIDDDLNIQSPVLELTCFRIIQESLTNTLKHAKDVTSISVRVQRCGDHVDVSVKDDGVLSNYSVSNEGTGKGIEGMRHRVLSLGGEFESTVLGERGFLVRAVLPLSGEP